METRGATGVYDTAERQLHAACLLAERRRACATRRRRSWACRTTSCACITDDVGGAFGMKTPVYPEYLALLVAAQESSAGRCIGCRRARKPSSPTRRRATPAPKRNSRSTTRASSWRCACAICAARAPMSPPPASASTPTTSRAACPACTASRRSTFPSRCVFHQHGADRPLSRRRPAGGELRARARRSRKPRASPASTPCSCARRT